MKLLAALTAALVYTSAAFSGQTIVISNDNGGSTTYYEQRAMRYQAHGDRLMLTGHCASACTMFLWRKFHLEVCAAPGTELWFHQPLWLDDADHVIVDEDHATMALHLWLTEDMAQLPPAIAAALRKMHVPSASAGEGQRNVAVLMALDFLPRCD